MKEEKNGNISVVSDNKSSSPIKTKKWWRVNKDMLPYKLHFFLFIGGMGAVLPYLSALGINRFALTASNLAAAYTTQQFLFILFKPGIGYLADYFNRLKATIVGLTVLQAFFCLFMIVIPNVDVRNLGFEPESDTTVENFNYYHLCTHYQDIQMISSKPPFDNLVLKQSISCFENLENDKMHCTEQTISCNHPAIIMYKIIHRTCNISYSNNILSTNISQSNKYDVFLISLSINDTQSIHIVCLHGKYENTSFLENYNTTKLLKEHCYSIPESENINLKIAHNLLSPSSTTHNLSCINQLNGIHLSTTEKNAILSAANFKTYQFWLYALFLISSCTCISSIFTMSDTACYESIHKTGSDYGRTRMWGAISWGLIAPFAGFLNDYTESYMASWCLMVILCSLQIWNLSKMNLIKPDFSQSILKDLKTVFSSMEFIAFEIGVFLNGIFTGIIWFYLTWFLVSIGADKLTIGLAHTVQCFLGEVPFMFFSGWMIKKLGHFHLVSLALFTHGVRFLIYSYIHNPWWILPVECLHGFTFGSFYSAMTSYGKLNSKPGTEATTQSVLCTTYEGMGAGVGCVISGICFDRFGGHNTFFYTAFLCALATGINIVSTFIVRCRKEELDVSQPKSENSDRY